MINPLKDGFTHINIYSKGKTFLGKKLSNFAKISFIHPIYGQFPSIESFWYFLKTIEINFNTKHQYKILFKCRQLYGYEIKKFFREEINKYPQYNTKELEKKDSPQFADEIKFALRLKILQNIELKNDFIKSSLPFKHYYVNSKNGLAIELPQYNWIVEYLEELRKELK